MAKAIYRLPPEMIRGINQFLDYLGTQVLCISGRFAASLDPDLKSKQAAFATRFNLPKLIVEEGDPKKIGALSEISIQKNNLPLVTRISKKVIEILGKKKMDPKLSQTALNQLIFFADSRSWTSTTAILKACDEKWIKSNEGRHETNALIQAICYNPEFVVQTIHKFPSIPNRYWKDIDLLLFLQGKSPVAGTENLEQQVLEIETLTLVAHCGRWDLIGKLLPRYCQPYKYPTINIPIANRMSICCILISASTRNNHSEIPDKMDQLIADQPSWLKETVHKYLIQALNESALNPRAQRLE